jgi:hypothetical protein
VQGGVEDIDLPEVVVGAAISPLRSCALEATVLGAASPVLGSRGFIWRGTCDILSKMSNRDCMAK